MDTDQIRQILLESLYAILRSWWTVVAGVCVGTSIALIALEHIPKIYQASINILADTAQLPKDFIRPTVSREVEVRLRSLRAAVLSPVNVRSVVVDVFGEPESAEDEERLVSRLSSQVQVTYSRRTRIIQIGYRDSDPQRVADVTNSIASLFLEENARLRTAEAALLTQSLESLAAGKLSELEDKKRQFVELTAKHPYETEDYRASHKGSLQALREELKEADTALKVTRNRLESLEAQRASGAGFGPEVEQGTETTPSTGVDARMMAIQAELDDLLLRYSDKHPEVREKKRELEDLRRSRQGSSIPIPEHPGTQESSDSSAKTPNLDLWAVQIRAASVEIERWTRESNRIRREIDKYERYLRNIPRVARELDDLKAAIDLLERDTSESRRKIETAKSGEQIEQADLGNPFEILHKASAPSQPVFPQPFHVLAVGVVAGLAIFIGPLLARRLLNPVIGSEAGLQQVADIEVLVSVPIIPTAESGRAARRARLRNIGLSTLSLLALAAVVTLRYLKLA